MDFIRLVWDWFFNVFTVHILTFLNSNFVVALLASMAGAYFGASAAQKVIQKNKRKEDLEEEIRNVNSAIMAAFTTTNMALTIKKQIMLPIFDTFNNEQAKFTIFEERRKANRLSPGETFHFTADLQDFDTPPFPIQILNETLFNKVNAESRALSAVAFLEASYSGLESMMNKRRIIIANFRANPIPNEQFAYFYFGKKMPSGDIQKEYSDAVNGIMSYIDDIIFFSKLISDDLEAYGKNLKDKERKILANYSIHHADYSLLEEQDLMPDIGNYESWLSGFSRK